MIELLKDLYVAIVSGNDEEAKHLMEVINFHFETLNSVLDTKRDGLFKAIDLCCDEITRLERENKSLKKEIERLKK